MTIDVSTLAVEVRSTGVKDTSDGLNKLFVEAGKAERRVKTLTDSIDKLATAFKQGTASAIAYQTAVANANRSVGGSNTATSALTQAMLALSGTLKTLNTQFGQLGPIQGNTRAINGHTAAMKDAHAMARGLAGSLGALWVTYGSLAPMAAGIAIGASFKAIVTAGASVENTMEGIRVKGEESMASISQMSAAIAELGKGVYGPQEVAKAFETLILAGLTAKQAMVGIKDAMNLAVVGGTSIEKAAYTQVQVATSLGYTAEGFGRVGDVIAKTAAVSMSSVESLSEAFKSASAVGKLYGASPGGHRYRPRCAVATGHPRLRCWYVAEELLQGTGFQFGQAEGHPVFDEDGPCGPEGRERRLPRYGDCGWQAVGWPGQAVSRKPEAGNGQHGERAWSEDPR
jgi:hypothetical protein